MERLSKRNLVLVGLTLFSMFFGAGNLIFPPFLGSLAGTHTWIAMAGFGLTAIGFPVLAVISVAKAGGFYQLAERVHPRFAFVFTLLNYLSIGPCLAIPRTASTSFEMAVVPFLGKGEYPAAPFLYSAVFFAIAFFISLNPDQLTNRLGKILTPCLLILIAVIFWGIVIFPPGSYGVPDVIYTANPLMKGFLEGYMTMDTLAALTFGIVISLNIQAIGVRKESVVVGETIKAGLIAGVILLLVYGALAHVGAATGGAFGSLENGAQTLNQAVRYLYGNAGLMILAAIFFIACLNTCIGLISCCSKYFCTIIPQIGYRVWALIFALISFLISNIGLTRILEISVPILNALYPVAIVLILLSFVFHNGKRWRGVYFCTISLTGAASVLLSLEQAGFALLHGTLAKLPAYPIGLGWLVPALFGCIIGLLFDMMRSKKTERHRTA